MSFTHTRSLHLDAGQQREDAQNRCTRMVFPAVTLEFQGFRGLFLEHYSTIRRRCLRFDRPGVAAFAFDATTGVLAASIAVAAKVGMANSAIIGRHSLADLYLADDAALSLRHLVLVMDPLRSANRFSASSSQD